MAETKEDPVVSPAWLAERLGAPDLRVIDATWFLPGDPRNARALYAERRIPGAAFVDIDEIADQQTALPHMLPSPAQFASRMRKLGIGDGARVVTYDNLGLFSAARVWWMLRAMGHEDVVVLDGGFPAWEAAGHPVEEGPPPARAERHFTARQRNDLVVDAADVRRALDAKAAAILDARPAARFTGEAEEPRPGLARGHMPGARSIPSAQLLTADGRLRPRAELESVFAEAGADLHGAVICTCGSGVTAAIIALALARVGRWDAALYDGSWAEWGALAGAPVATGPA